MAKQTMIDTAAFAGGGSEAIDLSGYANAITFSETVDEIDVTTLSDTVHRRIGALKDATFSFQCFDDDGGQPYDTLHDLFATTGVNLAWVESNASMAEEDRAVMCQVLEASYQRGGDIGGALVIDVSGSGDGPMVYGQVLQQDESLTVTGTSTGFQFGALAAGETLYCKMWVLSATAGTIDVTIESDDNSGFSSPTTQATFTQFSAVGFEEQTVSGAVTDDWWRCSYTIATGPFTILVLIGKK